MAISESAAPPRHPVPLSPRTEFHRLLFGPPRRRVLQLRAPQSEPPSQTFVTTTADNLLRGQSLKVEDANAVAEVIDELNARRIEALQVDDYRNGKKIEDAINAARLQFRLHDRDLLHREILERLEMRRMSLRPGKINGSESGQTSRNGIVRN
jgi:hypothetical protein